MPGQKRFTRFGLAILWALVFILCLWLLPRVSAFTLTIVVGLTQVMLTVLGAKAGTSPGWSARHQNLVVWLFAAVGTVGFVATIFAARASSKETAESSSKLAVALTQIADTARESKGLAVEAARIQRLNSDLQERLLALSHENGELARAGILSVTGGDSFAYVLLSFMGDSLVPVVIHSGKYPLYDVYVRITDTTDAVSLNDPWKLLREERQLGNLASGAVYGLGESGYIPNDEKTRISLNIFFRARNGFWRQNIRMLKLGEKWVTASQVTWDDGRLIAQRIDPTFPKNSAGRVDW